MAVKRVDAGLVGEGAIIGDDRVEPRLIVADQVHLVDREHDVADAEQMGEDGCAAGSAVSTPLRASIRMTARSAVEAPVDHVARILLVAGRVGDDELALVGREEAVGDVDGDALLALGGEAVDEQGEIERPACAPDLRLSLSSAASWSSNSILLS